MGVAPWSTAHQRGQALHAVVLRVTARVAWPRCGRCRPRGAAPWLATAFIPGPTLDQHVAVGGPLAGARLYALAAGTAAALSAVHEVGVVHRDVKPQNVILAPSSPMVLDFGIAHALDGTSVTRTGVMTGTPGWSSPEHYRTGTVGPEGDVFARGALVAYAATGRLPFGSGAADAVAFRVLSAEPDLDGMGDDLRQLVERALSKEPSGRPTAPELAQECGELLASQTTAVTGPTEAPQPTLIADLVGLNWDLPSDEQIWPAYSKRTSLTRLYLTVVAAAVLVGSLGGILLATQSSTAARGPASAPGGQKTPAAGLTPAAQHSASPATGPTLTASDEPSSSSPSPVLRLPPPPLTPAATARSPPLMSGPPPECQPHRRRRPPHSACAMARLPCCKGSSTWTTR